MLTRGRPPCAGFHLPGHLWVPTPHPAGGLHIAPQGHWPPPVLNRPWPPDGLHCGSACRVQARTGHGVQEQSDPGASPCSHLSLLTPPHVTPLATKHPLGSHTTGSLHLTLALTQPGTGKPAHWVTPKLLCGPSTLRTDARTFHLPWALPHSPRVMTWLLNPLHLAPRSWLGPVSRPTWFSHRLPGSRAEGST